MVCGQSLVTWSGCGKREERLVVVVCGQSLVTWSGCKKREERLVVVVCGQSLVTWRGCRKGRNQTGSCGLWTKSGDLLRL